MKDKNTEKTSLDKQARICVVGACQGVGATFVATSLAFSMAKKVSGVIYIESPKANRYKEEAGLVNMLSLERRAKKGMFFSDNISWDFRNEGKSETFRGRYEICDSPLEYRNFDLIICVVDSLPSKLAASEKTISHLEEYFFNKTIWVLNRADRRNVRHIEKRLKIKFDYCITMQPQESFYEAELRGKPLQKTSMFSEEIAKTVENMADYIIGLY